MYYGIQLAASGALTSLYRTDVYANNLANLNTVGFKPDNAYTRQRDVVRVEDDLGMLPSNELLEKLGAGVHMAANAVGYQQGPLVETGNALDVALDGDGFFVMRTLSDQGSTGIKFSRDGRFTISPDGRLVSATTGMLVLDEANSPIRLSDANAVTIDENGVVLQAGEEIARLQVADLDDRDLLTKQQNGVFLPNQDALAQSVRGTARVLQGMIEQSAVDPISAMMQVQAASRSVGTNIGMIAYQDKMMERAINTFARIS